MCVCVCLHVCRMCAMYMVVCGPACGVCAGICTCTYVCSVCVGKSLKFPPFENLMSWVKQPSPGMLLGHDPALVRPPTPS